MRPLPRWRLTGVGLLVGLQLAPCRMGHTQSPGPASAAQTHETYKREAMIAFRLGRYAEAIAGFERAYRAHPDHRLLFNLAMAYRRRFQLEPRRADLVRSCDLFERFLVLVPNRTGREDSKEQQARLIAEDRQRHCEGELERAARDRALTRPSSSQQGRSTDLLRPAAPPAVHARTEPSPSQVAPRQPSEPQRLVRGRVAKPAWVAYGTAAALAVSAAVVGGFALHADSDAREAYARGNEQRNLDLVARTNALALTTDVLIGAASAAAITGLLLHLGLRRREASRAHVNLGPGLVQLSGAL